MYKHPISALFRLLPALSWLAACVSALWIPLTLYLHRPTQVRWGDMTKAWPDALMVCGCVVVAVYAARMSRKEYKEALPALRADTPIRLGLPLRRRSRSFRPTRYPLSGALRAELHELIEALRSAGMLQSGEVASVDVIACAETLDEWSTVDLYLAMHVLHALRSEREQPFAHIAFFPTDVEQFRQLLQRVLSDANPDRHGQQRRAGEISPVSSSGVKYCQQVAAPVRITVTTTQAS